MLMPQVSTLFLILAGKFLEEIFSGIDHIDYNTREWIAICSGLVMVPLILCETVREMRFVAFLGVFAVAVVVLSTIAVSLSTTGNGSAANAS